MEVFWKVQDEMLFVFECYQGGLADSEESFVDFVSATVGCRVDVVIELFQEFGGHILVGFRYSWLWYR